MNKKYHATLTDLQTRGVARDYIHGWACGFLGHPKMEEQRVTVGYDAGYTDAKNGNTDNADRHLGG